MDEVAFIEILDRSGEVRGRHAVSRFPLTVGRGYDNDVIVDDPYMAARHLRIERTSSGELTASDLGTANGLYVLEPPKRVTSTVIGPDTRLRAGHTQLRVRTRDHPVPAELSDRRRSLIRRPVGFGMILTALAAIMLANQYVDTSERIELLKLGVPLLIIFALAAGWAGLWSFAGRMATRHANMLAHASVGMLGLIGLLLASNATEYTAFAFSARVLDDLMPVPFAVILALALFQHLRLVSRKPPRRLAVVAAAVALCVVGGITLLAYSVASEDLGRLRYMRYLKPPVFRLASGKTPEAFFSRAGALKPRLDRQIDQDE